MKRTYLSPRDPLPPNHPLRSATWIWPHGGMYLYNHFAHFRRDFKLARVPAKAPFFVTADKGYRLYVNGRYVCRGPARGYQSHWPFDEVDLAQFLRRGHNWIAVEAYNPGVSTFQYLHQTKAGFLCAARWGKFALVSDRQWPMRRSPAQARITARLSLQLDFQEHVDARLDDRTWIASPRPPKNWKAEIFPPAGQQFLEAPFGQPPYDTVEPRGIPLLREELVAPARVRCQVTGPCGDDYSDWQNVSWGWVREVTKSVRWGDGAEVKGRRRDGWFELVLEPTGVGRFRAVALEMPHYVVGHLLVEADGASGGEILDFQHSEGLVNGRPAIHEPAGACMIALANRLRLAKGRTAHEFFHLIGFRVLTVIARDLNRPVTLRLRVRNAGYPFAMRGRFACSDPTLNDIHTICRRTQQICALDSYVDTPWREQAQWWGDARVQARNTFYLDGDARLLARGIRSIAGQRAPQGLTYGHAPTCAYSCILPDFSLTWILTIWDYYWQTGDIGLFQEQWPRVQEVLAYFRSPEARVANGLLRRDRRFWLFGDWSDLYKGEVPTFLNLWYLVTLRHLVQLLTVAGNAKDAAAQRAEADAQERRVLTRLFDRSRGLFLDGLDGKGKPAPNASVHDQTMALILGLVPKAHDGMIRQRLLPYLRDEKFEGARPSAFWCTYVLEELARRGYGEECVAFIRRKWSPMLATGTTWEGFEWDERGGSASHAWTAHPSFHLVNIPAGITQAAPAWTTIRFAPCLVKEMNFVRAMVPSPQGDISVSWWRERRRICIELKMPRGVSAEVALPGRKVKVAGPAIFRGEVCVDRQPVEPTLGRLLP